MTRNIVFLPVCENCGRVIKDIIRVKDTVIDDSIYEDKTAVNYKLLHCSKIEPSRCGYCGADFEKVIIPACLPFDNSNFQESFTKT